MSIPPDSTNYPYGYALRPVNRLESRPRVETFNRSLSAEVRDALWMLTRQWQWGEFKGEDTGTGIFSRVQAQNTPITRFALGSGGSQTYTDTFPLEPVVEKQPVHMDTYMGLKIGQRWNRLLKDSGISNPDSYYNAYVTKYPFNIPSAGMDTSAGFYSNAKSWQIQNAALRRTMDGRMLYDALKGGTPASQGISLSAAGHATTLNDLGYTLKSWVESLYNPPSGNDVAWHQSHMEYQFACAIPEAPAKTGDPVPSSTVLLAKEYYHGRLDWYSFDIASAATNVPNANLGSPASSTELGEISSIDTVVIPTGVKFPGMPNDRWWEFENSKVNLGNIDANDTDTAKILLTEFGLVYSNDWNVVPYTVPVGSLSKVKSIVVTDVFGVKTLVKAAGAGTDNDWQRWNMFNLNTKDDSNASMADNRLFIPPVIHTVMEGKPVEAINFIRDEMANMVWGIETVVPDDLGGGRRGHEASTEFVQYLENLVADDTTGDLAPLQDVFIKYKLVSGNVPENWIPFIPVKRGSPPSRQIQLQRASMPRIIKGLYPDAAGNYPRIRPRTPLLRIGLNGDTQTTPFYIHNEEVPIAGAIVKTTFQRTRWYDGKIIVWSGRRKQTGRGEGASGLYFDQLKPVQE